MEEGALVREHTPAVHGEVLAQLWVTLAALSVMTGEVVTGHGGVDLVALTTILAVTVLVERTDHRHSGFLGAIFSETV